MKKYYGLYQGEVEDIEDPDNLNRVKCRILGLHTQTKIKGKTDGIPTDEIQWCEISGSLFGGFGNSGAGLSTIPEVGSWVYIMFINGDFDRPVAIGSIVGADKDEDVSDDDKTVLNTKSGHKITISDESGDEHIEIKDKNDNTVRLDSSGIEVNGNTTITGGTCTISGNATPSVNGKGSLCALPNCLFTGGVHIGETSSGT